jgi:hypothetical protein
MPKFPDRILEELAGTPKEPSPVAGDNGGSFESSKVFKTDDLSAPLADADDYVSSHSVPEKDSYARPEEDHRGAETSADAFARLDRAVLGRTDEASQASSADSPAHGDSNSESEMETPSGQIHESSDSYVNSEISETADSNGRPDKTESEETENPEIWGRHKQKKPSR